MSALDGFKDYEAQGDRYPTLGFGIYTLEVIDNSVIKVKKGKGEALLRAFKVVEAAPLPVADAPPPTPVGTDAKAKLLYMDQEWVEARIGEYVAGLTGAKKVTGEIVKGIFGGTNPAKGFKVKVKIEGRAAKGSGNEYHLYTWTHVPGQTDPAAKPAEKKASK